MIIYNTTLYIITNISNLFCVFLCVVWSREGNRILNVKECVVKLFFFSAKRKEGEIKMLNIESENYGNGTLKISPVSYDDEGTYECEANNGIGSGIRTNLSLFVRGMINLLIVKYSILISLKEIFVYE